MEVTEEFKEIELSEETKNKKEEENKPRQ